MSPPRAVHFDFIPKQGQVAHLALCLFIAVTRFYAQPSLLLPRESGRVLDNGIDQGAVEFYLTAAHFAYKVAGLFGGLIW